MLDRHHAHHKSSGVALLVQGGVSQYHTNEQHAAATASSTAASSDAALDASNGASARADDADAAATAIPYAADANAVYTTA